MPEIGIQPAAKVGSGETSRRGRVTPGDGVVFGSSTRLLSLATDASWVCYVRALNLIDKLAMVLAAVDWAGVALIAAGAILVAWKG